MTVPGADFRGQGSALPQVARIDEVHHERSCVVRSFDLADAATARLSFLSGGPADSFGLLLDNVVLSAGGTPTIPAVPEPSTWALLCGGLGVVAAISRRRHKPG